MAAFALRPLPSRCRLGDPMLTACDAFPSLYLLHSFRDRAGEELAIRQKLKSCEAGGVRPRRNVTGVTSGVWCLARRFAQMPDAPL